MSKIRVYFTDGHKAVFDVDKVSFYGNAETVFDFRETERPDEETKYSALVNEEKALVNWDNVSYVRGIADEAAPVEET